MITLMHTPTRTLAECPSDEAVRIFLSTVDAPAEWERLSPEVATAYKLRKQHHENLH